SNVAPRLGLAWQFRDRGAAKSVLRIGAGRFFDLGHSGVEGRPVPGTASSVFAQGLGLSVSDSSPPAALSKIQGLRPVVADNYNLPYTWEWNTTLEQAIGRQTVSAGYVGALGRRLEAWTQRSPNPSTYYLFFNNSSSSTYHALQLQANRRLSNRLHLI